MAFISLNWVESVKQYFAVSAKSQSKDKERINFKYTACVCGVVEFQLYNHLSLCP